MKHILIGLTLFLSACSSRSVPIQDARLISQDREIYHACKDINVRDPNPNLIVIREAHGFNTSIIYINGEPCIELFNEEKIALRLPAGYYVIGEQLKYGPFAYQFKKEVGIPLSETGQVILRKSFDGADMHFGVSAN